MLQVLETKCKWDTNTFHVMVNKASIQATLADANIDISLNTTSIDKKIIFF